MAKKANTPKATNKKATKASIKPKVADKLKKTALSKSVAASDKPTDKQKDPKSALNAKKTELSDSAILLKTKAKADAKLQSKSKSKVKKTEKKQEEDFDADILGDDFGDSEIAEYEDDLKAVEEDDDDINLDELSDDDDTEQIEAEVYLTDSEGRRLCRVRDCDQVSNVDGHCRYHYLLLWKKIQIRKSILLDGKLEKYVEDLTSRYPDKFLEMIKKDMKSEKDFLSAIQELEIDESALNDDAADDDAQSFADEIRGVAESPGLDDDSDF